MKAGTGEYEYEAGAHKPEYETQGNCDHENEKNKVNKPEKIGDGKNEKELQCDVPTQDEVVAELLQEVEHIEGDNRRKIKCTYS